MTTETAQEIDTNPGVWDYYDLMAHNGGLAVKEWREIMRAEAITRACTFHQLGVAQHLAGQDHGRKSLDVLDTLTTITVLAVNIGMGIDAAMERVLPVPETISVEALENTLSAIVAAAPYLSDEERENITDAASFRQSLQLMGKAYDAIASGESLPY